MRVGRQRGEANARVYYARTLERTWLGPSGARPHQFPCQSSEGPSGHARAAPKGRKNQLAGLVHWTALYRDLRDLPFLPFLPRHGIAGEPGPGETLWARMGRRANASRRVAKWPRSPLFVRSGPGSVVSPPAAAMALASFATKAVSGLGLRCGLPALASRAYATGERLGRCHRAGWPKRRASVGDSWRRGLQQPSGAWACS